MTKEILTHLIFFVPGNVPSSKNSKVWTGRFLVWSKAANKYRKETSRYWKEFAEQIKKNKALLDKSGKPLHIEFLFVRGTRHKFDYVNPLQTVLDLMVENGCLDDDNADEVFPTFQQYKYDPKNPGVYITISFTINY
jgi:Holliday junction resolvase RusA-like endonuclease